MPITEEPGIDNRTTYVRLLFEYAKDTNHPYTQMEADRQAALRKAEAAAAAKETRRLRLVENARRKRPGQKGSRPWQALGLTKTEWEHDGRPTPPAKSKESHHDQ